jgi:hypothetical protein
VRQTQPSDIRKKASHADPKRTCLRCLRLHSVASPCPHRADLIVTAVRQSESGCLLDHTLSPEIKEKAGEIASRCGGFMPDSIQ